ncbi:hypothetical protein Tco_0604644 [Tanacetum coccineum]
MKELEHRMEEMSIDLPSGISVEYFTYHVLLGKDEAGVLDPTFLTGVLADLQQPGHLVSCTKLLALRRQFHLSPWTNTETTLQGKYPKLQERKIELALIGKEGTMRDALIGKRLSLDLTFPIGFDCGRELCGAIKTMGSIRLSPALPSPRTLERARKGLLLRETRSHFLLKEDWKKLKVEKEGSDVYEHNEPQIEKADQGLKPFDWSSTMGKKVRS